MISGGEIVPKLMGCKEEQQQKAERKTEIEVSEQRVGGGNRFGRGDECHPGKRRRGHRQDKQCDVQSVSTSRLRLFGWLTCLGRMVHTSWGRV